MPGINQQDVHRRWSSRRNRDPGAEDYREEWYSQQCGGCLWWLPLSGRLGADWGACRNAASPMDQRVVFEHDGCESFEQDPRGWAQPHPPSREQT